jgi:hypothetical protein
MAVRAATQAPRSGPLGCPLEGGSLNFEYVACSCPPGAIVQYGRHYGALKSNGRDVCDVLIAICVWADALPANVATVVSGCCKCGQYPPTQRNGRREPNGGRFVATEEAEDPRCLERAMAAEPAFAAATGAKLQR